MWRISSNSCCFSRPSSFIGDSRHLSIRFMFYYIMFLSVVVVTSFPVSTSFNPIQQHYTTDSAATTLTSRGWTSQQHYYYCAHSSTWTTHGRKTTKLHCDNSKERTVPKSSGVTSVVVEERSSPVSFGIRRAKYGELGKVADLVVHSFYPEKSALVRPYLYLSELQRLQSNFPYSDAHHHFFIAYDREQPTVVVGFVDVDGRPSTLQNAPPRPYLSDLAVQPNYRRQGIAKALIQQCETIVSNDVMKHNQLYLRVERDNHAAIHMYQSLGYQSIPHPFFGVKDTTILLHKQLIPNNNNNNKNQKAVELESPTTTTTKNVLDYVV